MKVGPWFYLAMAASLALFAGAAPTYTLSPMKTAPEGLSAKVAAAVGEDALQLAGPNGPVAIIWLAKSAEAKAGFKSTLNVKYPLAEGQMVGALTVADGAKIGDFRGQEISPGTYTLRYAQQPMDGNHVGTSELADFLVAIPAKSDADPAPIKLPDQLHSKSAEASGTTHPAIVSLLPPKDDAGKPALEHDAAKDFWILNAVVPGKEGGKGVALRLVVVGKSEI